MILRYIYNFKHSYDRIADSFYWPAMDLLLWGLTGYYFASINKNAENAVTVVITAMIFWIIIWRAQYEITINLLTELWDKNLINLFGSPLKFSEWLVSLMLVGILKGIMSFLFAAWIAYLLYQINIFTIGWYLPLFVVLLFLNGWGIGFIVASILFRYGSKIQTLAWSFVWIIAPFAAVYYPIDILPAWAGIIAKLLPASYVFEQLRSLLLYNTMHMDQLFISLVLNIIYLSLGLVLITKSFTAVRKRGLSKLY